MQSVPVRSKRRTWLWVGETGFFGLLLAGMQILLLAQAPRLTEWSASPWTPLGLGVLVYLLIPTLAGFLTTRQQNAPYAPLVAGCLVGGWCFLVLTLLATASLVIALNAPLPAQTGRISFPPGYFIGFVVGELLVEGVGAAFGSLIGGALGGWLGRRKEIR